jgi:hypothetical protein
MILVENCLGVQESTEGKSTTRFQPKSRSITDEESQGSSSLPICPKGSQCIQRAVQGTHGFVEQGTESPATIRTCQGLRMRLNQASYAVDQCMKFVARNCW